MPGKDPKDLIEQFSEPPGPRNPACEPWEAAIASSADGTLSEDEEKALACHINKCSGCSAVFRASREGAEWMALLDRRPPVPENLLEKILVQTGPAANALPGTPLGRWPDAGYPAIQGGRTNQIFSPAILPGQAASHPSHRLLTAAMAVFSIALTLNLAGNPQFQPGFSGDRGLRAQFHSARGLVAGYYESFSQAQSGIVDQIKTIYEDLKHPAAKQIGRASLETQRKS